MVPLVIGTHKSDFVLFLYGVLLLLTFLVLFHVLCLLLFVNLGFSSFLALDSFRLFFGP